jgi:RES domain-containing protein
VFVWRLTHRKHIAPDGEGARRYGGRWNKPGTPVVYTSGTLSLAVLEFLVHVDSDLLPDSLVSVRATIPESVVIQTIHPSDLPGNWKDKIIPVAVQNLGTLWASAGTSAVLKIPSVVIEHEWNYVLNTLHPDFKKIRWERAVPFSFDPRLLS